MKKGSNQHEVRAVVTLQGRKGLQVGMETQGFQAT